MLVLCGSSISNYYNKVKLALLEHLNEGQRVSFDEEQSPKGPRAGNVRAE